MCDEPVKTCKQCGRVLPLSSFYTHKSMLDGHLNKCKECICENVRNKYNENISDPEFVEKERARGRDKWARLYKDKPHKAAHHVETVRRFIERRTGPLPEDTEVHHWNYNYLHKVFVLGKRHHARLHKLILFDEESQCFTYEGKVLATKEDHEEILRMAMPDAPYQYYDY